MLKTSFAFYSVSVLLFIFLFPIKLSGSEGNLDAFSGLYQMLLDIVPTDIISPFVNGNALQIIFIGVILGVTIFIAGDRATLFRDGSNQANTLLDIISEMLMKATGICFS